ncbi:MAG: alkaline phosphatase family protein [Pseudonocardiaceae bacterium]
MLAVLQFDSPSLELLDRMLGQGRLPALAGLRERGGWHDLETPATHFAAGAFHTLYSGTELADHGLLYPFQWSAPDQRVRYTTAFEAPPPVWERLPGARTLAIDPYESRAPRTAPAGTVVSGWQFTDRVVLQLWSSPPGMRNRLEQLFGPAAAVEEVFGRSSTRDLLRLRRDLLAASGRAADAAKLLLAGNRFDLTWLTFSAGHVAGHQFWDLSQVDDSVDAATRHLLSGALEEVYQSVDAAFGRVLAALPDGADVIVVSPVGMDVNTSRADLLPEMLDAVLLGGARPDSGSASGSGSVWKLRAALPTGLRSRVAAALPDRVALALTARLELRGQDWSSTRAFAQPADNQGYVRLNLRGRERDGIVSAAEAEPLMDQIATGLLTFHDPDGTPSVKAVERVADTFQSGIHSDRLPDLIVRWNDRPATRLDAVTSPQFGTVSRRGSGSGRSGNHTAGDAWALVVPGASRPRTPGRPPRLVDVAATAAALAGADLTDLPGEPLLQR